MGKIEEYFKWGDVVQRHEVNDYCVIDFVVFAERMLDINNRYS